jgi:hypothetical protein
MKAKTDIQQEKTEDAIRSVWSELEGTIKHRVEGVQSCVDRQEQGLRKKIKEKIGETQGDFKVLKTFTVTWTMTLKGNITDTKDIHEAIANTRNDFHEELMLQVEAHKMKVEIKTNQERMKVKMAATRREFQTQLKKVEAGAERGRGTRNDAGAVKPRAVFWSQFKIVADHKYSTR